MLQMTLANMHPLEYIAKTKLMLPKAQIAELFDQQYPADPILEPAYVGMTYRQVAIQKQIEQAAGGSGEALDRLLDRMIGKPSQVNTNVNVGVSYQDYLDGLEPPPEDGVIDVSINRPAEEIT